MSTIIQQGRFTSNGSPQFINIRSGFDSIFVRNETVLFAGGAGNGAEFFWQRGMVQGRGLVYVKLAADDSLAPQQIAVNAGFFEVDSSGQNPSLPVLGPEVAVTGVTNAAQPVFTTADTGLLGTGSIVRYFNDTNIPNITGFDFEVGPVTLNTNFTMRWALANAPGAVGAGANRAYRHVRFDPIFYPRNRFIVNLVRGATTVITTSVSHGFNVGQKIRLIIPEEFGSVQLDNLSGVVSAVDLVNNTFTLNIDSTNATAFTFPLAAAVPFQFAQAVPDGQDTAFTLQQVPPANILADASNNLAVIGVTLAAGALAPAGQNNDVIYWEARRAFDVNNL